MDELINIVKTLAPTLAATLGGPLSGLAVTFLSRLLTNDEKHTPQDLVNLLSSSPANFLKLPNAEEQFLLQIQKIGLDRDKIDQLNTANAREREIKLSKKNYFGNWIMPVLAILIVAGFFVVLAIVLWTPMQEDSKVISNILMGVLGAQISAIVNYYFGSSLGSSQKTFLLNGVHQSRQS